jgi:hypothetical protein
MKTIVKNFTIFLLILGVTSCEQEESEIEPTYGKPTITAVNNIVEGDFFVGKKIKFSLSLNAPGFLDKLEISRNENLLETITYNSGGQIVYEFDKQVEPAWLGTTQVFSIKLFDKKGVQSEVFTFTATINNLAPTYLITDVTMGGTNFKKITGKINIDETLSEDQNWLLSEVVDVEDGSTLTINANTKIYAETATTALNVLSGGKILANGTATAPIVFSSLATAPGQSGTPAAGNWIGLTVNGSATATNSGIYKYVRVEFGGNNGNDAFKFVNVGNATEIDYIQAFKNGDNGIRINGGNVNVKHALGTANTAVNIRYGAGWVGLGQFWITSATVATTSGIQGRDAGSNPTLANITVTGPSLNVATGIAGGDGIRIRNNAKAQIYNTVVTGVGTAIRFSDGSENFVPTGEVLFRNSACFDNTGGGGFHSSTGVFNPASSSYLAVNNNSTTAFAITNNYVGSSTTNSVNPATINSVLEIANYVGAVQAGSDWTVGWTRNPDGTLR